MNSVGIIPARYESSRFPGKVLANINGKPMIQHVWEEARKARLLDELIVACDDDRVINVVKDFGGKAIFTSKSHASGTDRLKEIINPLDVNIVVNIQADEPLLHHSMINNLVSALQDNNDIVMASLMKRIEDFSQLQNSNTVKVVVDKNNFALYFSRYSIPFMRDKVVVDSEKKRPFFKHLGLYSYTKDFLFTFANFPQSPLEKCEKLEQLRAIENGYRIKMIETEYDTIGVDTPEDLELARKQLNSIEAAD
ncbi:MAG: 3-deoxy-manno-octulosonate cytidylyltransferase [Candidatus Omnitrophota bacterium]